MFPVFLMFFFFHQLFVLLCENKPELIFLLRRMRKEGGNGFEVEPYLHQAVAQFSV